MKSLYIKLLIVVSFFLIPTFFTPCLVSATPSVLFDETGPADATDYTIYNLGPFGGSSFAALLQANGYTVSRTTTIPITYQELKNYNVFIIMAPARNYTDQEISAIQEYVNNGGGLFLMANGWNTEDGDQNYAFNKLARSFGVDFKSTILVADTSQYFATPTKVKVTNITPNPVTSNINYFYFFRGTYMQNTGSSNVVAYSSNTSFADKGFMTSEGFSMTNEIKDPGEISGPFPLFSVMNYGQGKVVFFGAVGTFMNSWLYRSNGWKIEINSVNYLSNQPTPTTYKTAALFSPTVGDMPMEILEMIIFTMLVLAGLILSLMRFRKIEKSYKIKTIKNRIYYLLITINGFFTVLGAILFIPINFILLDISNQSYDPYFGYTLLSVGILFLIISGMNLYHIIFRERILSLASFLNIALLIFFAGLTLIIGDIFSFSPVSLFTIGSIILLIPFLVNLWFIRGHGPDLIIEGKEFNRLARLSVKTLPYELHGTYKDPQYIGEGGFGRVYKANHKGKDVALKIPKTFDKRAEKTFISEISNWSQLNHPNIVKLYDFKILPIPFIEMEYCNGSLEHIKQPLERVINIIYESANGLGYAHRKNIIHGDVKTSNILIKNGVYKVSDWGLSKVTSGESVSLSGATPQYAAPEQISHQFGKADVRTDIYQLGTVFYELVTGNLPFKGDMAVVYGSILNSDPTPPSEINPEARSVEPIIMKCLNKIKDKRYASMKDLMDDLEKFKPEKFDDKTVMYSNENDEGT